MSENLKKKTVNALLWNSIDKVFSQVCFAVTGIILANMLFVEDYGAFGILNVFLAFVTIFTDGGFYNALIQKKDVTAKDYNTVFLFNLAVGVSLYIVLFLLAPVFASYYGDERLIVISRVMFLNIICYLFGLVQSSILMKEMNMRKLSIINVISQLISSATTLIFVFNGYGIWSIVVQPLSYSFCRSLCLWISNKWRPKFEFSFASLQSFWGFGSHMLLTNFVNTFFRNINNLIIGSYDLKELGYYTQAEKWSNMGTTSLSQAIGQSAFPALSSIQDDKERVQRAFKKINRATSYLSFPAFAGLIIIAQPLFHLLFGTKWDPSVLLFQLLIIRGFFFIYSSLLNNYLMAIGNTRIIFRLEAIKDILIVAAILITIRISIPALVIGQVVCGGIHYILTALAVSRYAEYSFRQQVMDMLPFIGLTFLMSVLVILAGSIEMPVYVIVPSQVIIGSGSYFLLNKLTNSHIQQEILDILHRRQKL